MASRSGVRAPERHHGMIRKFQSGRRRWREVKRRPVQGNSPNDRILRGPDGNRHKRVYADSFPATPLPQVPGIFPECVWGGMRNLSVRWDGQNHSPTASAVVSCLPLVGPEAARGPAPRIDDEVLKPIPFVYRSATKCEGPRNAFVQAWRNLSVRCVLTSDKPGPGCRFTVGSEPGYRTRRKKHALPIVRDEFRPAIP